MIYKSKFLDIIARCLRGEVGVNLISKVYNTLQIKNLVELLEPTTHKIISITKELKYDSDDEEDIEN